MTDHRPWCAQTMVKMPTDKWPDSIVEFCTCERRQGERDKVLEHERQIERLRAQLEQAHETIRWFQELEAVKDE